MNTYAYVENNPVKRYDLYGLESYPDDGEWAGGPSNPEMEECARNCLYKILGPSDALMGAGMIPIYKRWIGKPVMGNASRFTNPISLSGEAITKGNPRKGKIGKKVFGTNRWAGLAGRLNIAAFGAINYAQMIDCLQECHEKAECSK